MPVTDVHFTSTLGHNRSETGRVCSVTLKFIYTYMEARSCRLVLLKVFVALGDDNAKTVVNQTVARETRRKRTAVTNGKYHGYPVAT